MSSHFAEATVRITPSLTGFVKDLEGQLAAAMAKVKPPVVRVQPALSKDFIGSLRAQVNAAVLKAQTGIKPIIIKSVVKPPTKAELAAAGARTPVVTGTGAGRIATGAAATGAAGAGAAERLTAGERQLVKTQELVALSRIQLSKAIQRGLPLQEKASALSEVASTLDKAQATAEETLAKAIVAKDVALEKSARRQLSQIGTLQRNVAPRITGVETKQAAIAAQEAQEKELTKIQEQQTLKRELLSKQEADARAAAIAKIAAANEALRERISLVPLAASPTATPVAAARAEAGATKGINITAAKNAAAAAEAEKLFAISEDAAGKAALAEAAAIDAESVALRRNKAELLDAAIAEQAKEKASLRAAKAQDAAIASTVRANTRINRSISQIPLAGSRPGLTPVQAATARYTAANRQAFLATEELNIAIENNAKFMTQASLAAEADLRVTQELALAEKAAAESALQQAVSEKARGAQLASTAKKQEELNRGFLATILSRLGIRGATLAASAPFLIGAAAVTTFALSIKEASNEEEALARVQRILGPSALDLEKNARGMATAYGLSATEVLKASGAFAELFHNVGIANPIAASMSEQIVKLAADMAAFNNVNLDATLRALQQGLAGNMRGLKQYGIIINQATVGQEGLRATGKAHVKDLTREELLLARYNLVLKDTANQQGAAASRAGGLAQQSRVLRSELANTAAIIGSVVLPRVADLLDLFIASAAGIGKLVEAAVNIAKIKIPEIHIHFIVDWTIGGQTVGDIIKWGGWNELQLMGKILSAPFKATPAKTQISQLEDELTQLQQTRASLVNAQALDLLPGVDAQIAKLKKQIDDLKTAAGSLTVGGLTTPETVKASIDNLEKLRKTMRGMNQDTGGVDRAIKILQGELDQLNTDPVKAKIKALNDQIIAIRRQHPIGPLVSSTDQARIDSLLAQIDALKGSNRDLSGGLGEVSAASRGVGSALDFAALHANSTAAAFAALTHQSALLDDQLLALQVAGAGPAQIIANRQADIIRQQKIISEAQKGGIQKGDPTAIRKARQKIISDQQEIATQQGDIAQAKKDAAQKIKDAQTKADAAGQAIIDSILNGRNATILQNAITSAGLTDQLTDDQKTTGLWIAYLKRQKDTLVKRLKAVGASKKVIHDALVQINAAIFSATNDLINLTKQQQANAAAQAQALLDTALEKADLRIQIQEAQVTDQNKNIPGLIKAHRAKLAVINKELALAAKQYGKNSVEWLRLKAAQQQEIQAINALKGTTAKRNDALAKLTFEFLQSQQGFTATLLGNLFPINPSPGLTGAAMPGMGGTGGGIVTSVGGGAVAGVGIGAISIPGVASGIAHGGGNYPGTDLQRAQTTAKTQGSTAGQMSQLIEINRQMLQVLRSLSGATKNPEARNQHVAQASKSFFPGHG